MPLLPEGRATRAWSWPQISLVRVIGPDAERESQSRGLLFQRLLSAGVRDRPMTYDELVPENKKGWPANLWDA